MYYILTSVTSATDQKGTDDKGRVAYEAGIVFVISAVAVRTLIRVSVRCPFVVYCCGDCIIRRHGVCGKYLEAFEVDGIL